MVVSDSLGRPWRQGVVDVAIRVAGLEPMDDLRGRVDGYGNPLEVTVVAVADEIAAAAELVKTKLAGVPMAVVRGLTVVGGPDGPGAAAIVRPAADDMFSLGTAEARRERGGQPGARYAGSAPTRTGLRSNSRRWPPRSRHRHHTTPGPSGSSACGRPTSVPRYLRRTARRLGWPV